VEKVETATKHLKTNNSPGTDSVAGEMTKYGGKKEIHGLCNRVWKERNAP